MGMEQREVHDMSEFLVGTYGRNENQGIWKFSWDIEHNTFTQPERADAANKSSYLCRYGDLVYALSETQGSGMLHAFRLKDGKLELLNRVGGLEPVLAHLSVSRDGRHIFRISYGTGQIGVTAVGQDGALEGGEGCILHEGCGPFPGRQTKAHGHSITPAPDGMHVIVCDLGTDEVLCLDLDPDSGEIQLNPSMSLSLPGGTGPRQQAWHPAEDCVYVVTEMGYMIATLGWNAERGLCLLDCREIRPELPKIDREGAAVKVSPDGHFLYTSCRLDGNLDIFKIGTDRIPTRIGTVSSGVEQPRDFLITRDGLHLLAAGQRSGDICLFRRDPETGALESVGRVNGFEQPVCLMEL